MRNPVALLASVILGLLLAASPALAPEAQVPGPSSLALVAAGIGAAGLYALLKRRR
jgi:hypothetical protein